MNSLLSTLFVSALAATAVHPLALEHKEALAYSTYIVADHGRALAASPEELEATLPVLRDVLVSKVIIEVYRGGVELEQGELETLRDFYREHGFSVMAGIATVPGGDFGVESNRGGYWFNYQAQKTRDDLERVCRAAARVFDAFVVDDFLCTQDDSPMSLEAKGERDWGAYRRELITSVARDTIINPMREENPDIHVIIKYPQWYDRFHLFGYDVTTLPALFDEVWAGTETRGRNTKRFGFTQPYEGLVNYRWLSGLSGGKMGLAWFDHGDCDANDFIEQAYTTVLAGAREAVLFQYGDLKTGHGGHDLLRAEFAQLAELARTVAQHPVSGVAAYKPAQSDPAGEMYLMDYLGMFGISLVPVHEFPEDSPAVLLPAHAAHDPGVAAKAEAYIARGGTLVMTLGFLADARGVERLAELAGVSNWRREPALAQRVSVSGQAPQSIERGVAIEGVMNLEGAEAVITASAPSGEVPLLTRRETAYGQVAVLNVHTYSQADFEQVEELLLSPAPLGLLDVDRATAGALRSAFAKRIPTQVQLDAPVGVTLFDLRGGGCFLQNHNDAPAAITLRFTDGPRTVHLPNGEELSGQSLEFELPARSRVWVKRLFAF
ncbi:MAG: hypothetical protein RLZZ303_1750 [Candidatus Hydrogenedentota bacterium]|jgi:hypothetical protein